MLKCPNCGQEMESGYLNAYSPAGRAIAAIVSLKWKDYTKEHEERIGSKGGIGWASLDVEAYRCQNCQFIVFSYAKKDKSEFQEDGVTHYDEVEKYLR